MNGADCLAEMLVDLVAVPVAKLSGGLRCTWVDAVTEVIAALPAANQEPWIQVLVSRIHAQFPGCSTDRAYSVQIIRQAVVHGRMRWQVYRAHYFQDPEPIGAKA